MSYKIGQVRKSNTNYLTNLAFDKLDDTITTIGYGNVEFNDVAFQLRSGDFNNSNTYYVRFTIRRYVMNEDFINSQGTGNNDPKRITLTIKLLKENAYQKNGFYALGTYQDI